jgi:imidazolonepropionase-like amidohydrolase
MRTLVRAGRLIGPAGSLPPGSSLLLEDERIEALLDPSESEGIQADRLLDFSAWTVLPGLVDAHVHLAMGAGSSHEAVWRQIRRDTVEGLLPFRVARNACAAMRAGLTTVRDLGDRDGVTLGLRRAARAGLAEAPDLVLAGSPITSPGGHLCNIGIIARGVKAVQVAVEQLVTAGVDQIKVIASGGNMTPGSNPLLPQFDAQELAALVNAAHAAGKRVAAHALCATAIRLAVQAGADTIEHGLWQDERGEDAFDPVLAEQMARSGVAVVMTLSGYLRRDLPGPNDKPGEAEAKQQRLAHFWAPYARLRKAGVRVVAASDAGVRFTPISHPARMLKLLVYGFRLPLREALAMLTVEAAAAIGLTDRGALVGGQRADLVAVEGDLLADPSVLRQVRAVLLAGRLVHMVGGQDATSDGED